jgi:hypothetical protein
MQPTVTTPALHPELTDEPPDAQPPVRLPDAGPTCLCGAQLAGRQTQCRKCRARERWHRRNRLADDNRRRTDSYRTSALLLGGAR